MSYILDALKRADADRERGHVPGLHSQKPTPYPADRSVATRRSILVSLALVTLLGGVGALAWWILRGPAAPPPDTVVLAAPAAETPAAPEEPAEAAIEIKPPDVQAAASMPILAPEPPPAVQPLPEARPVRAAEPEAADDPDMVEQTPEAEAPADEATDTAPPPPPPTAVAPPARPPAVRPAPPRSDAQGRPEVRVSGSSYSANPAHRMLIANGKVVHEGQDIEPGLRLETIGPRSAVLNHRGTLYNITY